MRHQKTSAGLTALAIAGSYVVVLGWDMAEANIRQTKILGFAIRRTRHSDGEVIFLGGMKTFVEVEPNPVPGNKVSSYRHPIQSFQWSDYSASPGETYDYEVIARGGTPLALSDKATVKLTVTTEPVDLGRHAVFFNRGSIASQEYALRFQNRKPDEVGQAAYDWLSRGLIESLERFIDRAQSGDALHGAFFEFKNKRIYARLKAAKGRGAVVRILYDGDSQREGNEEALVGSGIVASTKARTRSGGFAHNKFLVYSANGAPSEVWTGSTNLSENGIFGHSNNAHLIRDPQVASSYFRYWQLLHSDRTLKPTATAATQMSPAPLPPGATDSIFVFSPRTSLQALDWYAALAGAAQRALFMTFAFGMNSRFVQVYDNPDNVIRFALMEKKGSGKTIRKQSADVDRIRRHPNVTVSVGAKVELNQFDQWLQEIDRVTGEAHVLYVHTKYMLVDPLGPAPVVVVGSANFSQASTDTNDENMLVIRANPAVADVYLGEFMRLFSHYAFRESRKFKSSNDPVALQKRKHLISDVSWIDANYFVAGQDRFLRRLYFSGQ
ncbi:MAG TPA: phospholipase D-like domain-containing protein [Sphingomicrobium sp.]|nr:phospholipase D-like domain-containing protein [Sphingomicrobium sp.]